MDTDKEVRELAYNIWEQEGCPEEEGFRALL